VVLSGAVFEIPSKPAFHGGPGKIGTVYDIVVAPDKWASYAIIKAKGFIGIPRRDVAASARPTVPDCGASVTDRST
jgi:hypothetical protein